MSSLTSHRLLISPHPWNTQPQPETLLRATSTCHSRGLRPLPACLTVPDLQRLPCLSLTPLLHRFSISISVRSVTHLRVQRLAGVRIIEVPWGLRRRRLQWTGWRRKHPGATPRSGVRVVPWRRGCEVCRDRDIRCQVGVPKTVAWGYCNRSCHWGSLAKRLLVEIVVSWVSVTRGISAPRCLVVVSRCSHHSWRTPPRFRCQSRLLWSQRGARGRLFS